MKAKAKAKAKDVLRFCRRFVRAGEAVSALEYAILVGVIVAGIAVALVSFSSDVTDAIEKIGKNVESVQPKKLKVK